MAVVKLFISVHGSLAGRKWAAAATYPYVPRPRFRYPAGSETPAVITKNGLYQSNNRVDRFEEHIRMDTMRGTNTDEYFLSSTTDSNRPHS